MASPSPLPTKAEEFAGDVSTDTFTGQKLRCLNEPLLKECGFNSAYRGFWMRKEVGVRRVLVEDCHENWSTVVDKHQDESLSHENVLKVFGCEEDGLGQWRYTFPYFLFFP